MALALVAGVAVAVQAKINGVLAVKTDDALLAAVISFGGGLVVLLVILALTPSMRAGLGRVVSAVREVRLRRWHLFGGLGGASLVASQGFTVGVLGVAMFTVGVVAGQTVTGLIVDKVGLGPAGVRPLTAPRIVGAVLMLVAVATTMWGGMSTMDAPTGLLVLLPFGAGLAIAVQQAVNGRVSMAARNPLTATLVNFAVGTLALIVAWAITLIWMPGDPGGLPSNPVLYIGGVFGIAFIAMAAFVVRWIGVLLLGLATIAGQLIGSVLIDVVMPTSGGGPAVTTLVGVALALVAIGIASGVGGTMTSASNGRT